MAKELWIGVDEDGSAFLYGEEPQWRRGWWHVTTSGSPAVLAAYVGKRLPVSIPPGHKAKLVLDEASVTKGGA